MALLKLDKDDPKRELEFEIESALKLSPDERLKHWLEWNLTMLEFMEQQRHEPRKTADIVKRA